MAFLEDAFGGLTTTNVLIGIGALVAVPLVLPMLRPLAKTTIRGGLYVADTAREMLAEAGEQVSDLVAEVRAEAGHGGGRVPAATER
jgi:hypothetical protein